MVRHVDLYNHFRLLSGFEMRLHGQRSPGQRLHGKPILLHGSSHSTDLTCVPDCPQDFESWHSEFLSRRRSCAERLQADPLGQRCKC